MKYEIGEMRDNMSRDMLALVERIMAAKKGMKEPYYMLVHTQLIADKTYDTKIMVMTKKQLPKGDNGRVMPLIGTLLFRMDNQKGKLELMWSLPRDIPETTFVSDTYGTIVESVAKQAFQMGMPLINA
jgi:hypothetical protein